jgi:hypothetical protein
MHRSLSSKTPMWFDGQALEEPQSAMVLEARSEIARKGKQITPGAIVAELSLGFWTALLSARYEKSFWVPSLHKIFQAALSAPSADGRQRKMDRGSIHETLERVRTLRNRIAHHESILKLPLEQRYQETITALRWICPVSAQWVEATNCFSERFSLKTPGPSVAPKEGPRAPARPGMPLPRRPPK